ncbi:hypothetical protein [Candidatus Pelagibacter sp. HIMB1506]|uniref:hypothetical protein n=1 Tax=Candidatus Pelagibacter sp. HIMB1506 TaxID=3413337 RepID=UPI003F870454
MKFGELQPYRVWFDYLKTCLLDEKLNKKIDKEYYKSWNLSEIQIKNSKFDKWFKTHSHLFTSKGSIKIINKITNPQSITLEIPTNFKIKEIQREIPKLLKDKVNKSTSRFVLTHQRKNIKTVALDSFLIAWKFRQKNKDKKLEDIWELTNNKIDERQGKVKTLLQKGKLRRRKLQGVGSGIKSFKNKSVIISRNILKASKILENVCKGKFPGEYSDN